MSRRKKNLRAFLHQVPNPTIEQAWEAAWEGAQKHYHSKRMNELVDENKRLQDSVTATRRNFGTVIDKGTKLREAGQAVVDARANHMDIHGVIDALAAALEADDE